MQINNAKMRIKNSIENLIENLTKGLVIATATAIPLIAAEASGPSRPTLTERDFIKRPSLSTRTDALADSIKKENEAKKQAAEDDSTTKAKEYQTALPDNTTTKKEIRDIEWNPTTRMWEPIRKKQQSTPERQKECPGTKNLLYNEREEPIREFSSYIKGKDGSELTHRIRLGLTEPNRVAEVGDTLVFDLKKQGLYILQTNMQGKHGRNYNGIWVAERPGIHNIQIAADCPDAKKIRGASVIVPVYVMEKKKKDKTKIPETQKQIATETPTMEVIAEPEADIPRISNARKPRTFLFDIKKEIAYVLKGNNPRNLHAIDLTVSARDNTRRLESEGAVATDFDTKLTIFGGVKAEKDFGQGYARTEARIGIDMLAQYMLDNGSTDLTENTIAARIGVLSGNVRERKANKNTGVSAGLDLFGLMTSESTDIEGATCADHTTKGGIASVKVNPPKDINEYEASFGIFSESSGIKGYIAGLNLNSNAVDDILEAIALGVSPRTLSFHDINSTGAAGHDHESASLLFVHGSRDEKKNGDLGFESNQVFMSATARGVNLSAYFGKGEIKKSTRQIGNFNFVIPGGEQLNAGFRISYAGEKLGGLMPGIGYTMTDKKSGEYHSTDDGLEIYAGVKF